MPTILRIDGYRFHFYSREGNEPPHVHVARDDLEAKFWLDEIVLSKNYGFSPVELNKIAKMVKSNQSELIEAYRKYHG